MAKACPGSSASTSGAIAGLTLRARLSQRTSLVPRSTGACHSAATRSCASGRFTTIGPEGVSTLQTSHETPPVSGARTMSPSSASPAARNCSAMSALVVTSELLPDPSADEIGCILAFFDRILEIMGAGDQFQLLVARAQEVEDLARVAGENAGIGGSLDHER